MVDNTRGILAMSAAVVVFIFNDALIKLAAESMPSVQAIGVRGLFATLWCALALLVTGAWRQIHWAAHPRVVFRGVLEAGSAILYLVALFQIPFAIATAVNLSTPVILTVLAVLILKEEVRWRRWSAVTVGFVGVLLVIQPHPGDLNAWTWVALAGTVIGCFRDIFVRFLPVGMPTLVVSFTTGADRGRRGLRLGGGRGLAADERPRASASSLARRSCWRWATSSWSSRCARAASSR